MLPGYPGKTVRVCFVGDSFVNGTGDDACLGWVGRVCGRARAQGSDITVYNLGIRRDTSADIVARWADETARRLPTGIDGLLVFSFGVNDTTLESGTPRVRPEDSVANARAILGAAQRLWPTLMVGPPPIGDDWQNARIEALSAAFATACQQLGVPYLETFRPLLQSEAWMNEARSGDGAHPNAAGYATLGDLVAGWPAWQTQCQLRLDAGGR